MQLASFCVLPVTGTLNDISAATTYENSHVGVTRALGDFHLKQLKYKSSDGTRWQGPLIAGCIHCLVDLPQAMRLIICPVC